MAHVAVCIFITTSARGGWRGPGLRPPACDGMCSSSSHLPRVLRERRDKSTSPWLWEEPPLGARPCVVQHQGRWVCTEHAGAEAATDSGFAGIWFSRKPVLADGSELASPLAPRGEGVMRAGRAAACVTRRVPRSWGGQGLLVQGPAGAARPISPRDVDRDICSQLTRASQAPHQRGSKVAADGWL